MHKETYKTAKFIDFVNLLIQFIDFVDNFWQSV